MSGHSKWATTKRAKAVVDAKRGKQFTKIANAITVAAKEGGGTIDSNPRLRAAVDAARAASMPKENIERAIKRGTGELAGVAVESVMYEGFASGGSAVMVEAITDNRNRTAQLVKSAFQKFGASLGGPGAVAWMFDRRGVIRLASGDNILDELELIELGADDIINQEVEIIIITSPEKFLSLKNSLVAREQEILEADVIFWPKTPAEFPGGEAGDKLGNFLAALDDIEEVDKVATSAVL